MSRLTDFDQGSFVPNDRLWLLPVASGQWRYRTGLWSGPAGMVKVYVDDSRPLLILEIVTDGSVYARRWEHAFSDRTIARLARQFALDVAERHRG